MRIIFMGSPDFALPALDALMTAPEIEVVAVYTQPPRHKNRGKHVQKTPVHQHALQHGVPVHVPTSLRDAEEQEYFTAYAADAAVVAAYGLLLPPEILTACAMGCINLHPSDLPRWRGAAPIARTLLAGDTETSMCIMQMDEGLDTGAVLDRTMYSIAPQTTAGMLHDAMADLGAQRVLHVLRHYAQISPIKQTEKGVCYAKKINKSEALLDFSQPIAHLQQKIYGLNPVPGAYFTHAGERIKILEANVRPAVQLAAGKMERVSKELQIGCADGILLPTQLQRQGKKICDVNAFLNGFVF